MTAVMRPADRPLASVRPRILATVVFLAVIAANVAATTVLFFAAGLSGNTLIDIGRLTGLYGGLVLTFQLILVARLPWLDRRIGMDRLTTWHRWTAIGLLWSLVAHFVFTVFGYAELDDKGVVDEFVSMVTQLEGVLRAVVAFALIVLVGGVSARFVRRRMSYETWHFIHLYAYAAVVLGFGHQVMLGKSFASGGIAWVYWYLVWVAGLASVIVGRLVLPLARNLRHRLRIVAVVPESAETVSVYMTGRHLDRMPVKAGQFFLWRFLTKDRWWQANPYSLSAAPDGRTLRLTAKAAGDGSSSLRSLKVGTWVFAEGPYGAFTAMHQRKTRALLVAGGVGITPLRALLEEIAGHVILVYRVRSEQDAVLLPEIKGLARARGAAVHVLAGPSDWSGPFGPLLGPDSLWRLVPDIRERDVFVCGPPGMTSATLRSLREIGVPRQQVHAERFSLTI
ncbi:ferredoxin reductase family protein [Amycolatopsis oliviviridis]|uniref:Oxidoreductase n=2 Tax=Amycolatopsis oliviviridis TaxID=1471590 RepID=A0ABQ3L7E5_9PSEU|nr:ferredoxin reductase family protein [Amycolatopsis oliviviridis]GHH07710.1 oxidoreductase [Amycolatopsis oliviviridis]